MEEQSRQLAALCNRLHSRGWVANHDGNVTCRLSGDRFLASPTAVSKGDVRPEMLIVVGPDGAVVSGSRKVFSEISLHLACYQARSDVSWVVHAHPPVATGFAVAGVNFFDPPFLPEAVVSLGDHLPLVPFQAPGELPEALREAIGSADAALLANHGVVTVGPDAETAFLRMELVEHLARIALTARQVGGAKALPPEVVERLLAARAKAGLGPQGRARSATGTAPAPAWSGDVSQIVAEALKRFS